MRDQENKQIIDYAKPYRVRAEGWTKGRIRVVEEREGLFYVSRTAWKKKEGESSEGQAGGGCLLIGVAGRRVTKKVKRGIRGGYKRCMWCARDGESHASV